MTVDPGASILVPVRAEATRVITGVAPGARWELAQRPIPERLRGIVRSWSGYVEHTSAPSVRDELPIPELVLIFELGPPIQVAGVANRGGFVAGLDDAPTRCAHEGWQSGLQVNLTPIGARLVLGLPLSELTGRVFSVHDVLAERALAERLADAPSWDARFDLVERTLLDRIEASRLDLRATLWAVERIHASRGALEIGGLVRGLGYSHKHVITLFRDHVGLAPKAFAAIVRFDALVQHLRSGRGGSWAELAQRFGFADQAHLAREVRRLAHLTPTALRAQLAGTTFGIVEG